ncbi:uncharacterized protein C2845_PM05G02070 [Panicum miliaceum]|uniref:F-box protein n=1 Tax=Panicum miliaceum TaxID=4540 RepID=A0A3L6T3F9_PANMI|nr:uncharacterized protein C2845_PM05G02070 [Panicum miliaceum]
MHIDLARAADFTFSFLPSPNRWDVRHMRDGLVLLSRMISDDAFHDLVVCDPLRRRYVLVPPVPEHLAAFVPKRDRWTSTPFLAPAGGDFDDGKEETWPFSVVCTVASGNKAVAFVFCSSGNGEWRGTTYNSSSMLPGGLFGYTHGYHRSYVHGCFYWIVDDYSYSLVLDTRKMEFSDMDLPLPPDNGRKHSAIVDAGEGMLGMLTFDSSRASLFRMIRRNNSADAEWEPFKMIPLPKDTNRENYVWLSSNSAAEVHLLMATRWTSRARQYHYHTLDLKTLLLQRLCGSNLHYSGSPSHIYERFPPLLSPPSI